MPTRLIELVERLGGRNVVLVGDLMLDKYLYGDAERLSPDAPVPVLQFRKEDARLGGAGRVAADLGRRGGTARGGGRGGGVGGGPGDAGGERPGGLGARAGRNRGADQADAGGVAVRPVRD